MKILIVCATPGELKTVKSQIKSLNLKTKLQIDYLCTGMGNYAMIFALTKYLTQHAQEEFFLVNIGVCGYYTSSIPPKLLQIGRIKNLATSKELLPPLPFLFGEVASIYSSEVPMTRWNIDGEGFVDMESWGFELVADHFRFPRLLLKVPCDKVGEETLNFDRTLALSKLAQGINYQDLIQKILSRAEKSYH
ncbi:MAG: hypothetical protein HG456_001445 [candidate division SR1 bacterium]|nr:hypothetical protein [candidate division SR1 bacterium]